MSDLSANDDAGRHAALQSENDELRERLARLQAFTVDLAATLEPAAVAQRVADEVVRETEAHSSESAERLAHLLGLAGLALERSLLYERSREQARRDSLTGLLGHRTFHDGLQALEASGSPFTLVLADIDDFKQINDLYGHPVGDEALREVARALCSAVRAQDMVYRIGGEEFAVLLPGLAPTAAADIAERLRRSAERIAVPLPVTVSIGVATFPDDADTRDTLLARADAALYVSKSSGKNKTTLAGSLRGETRLALRDNRLDLRLLHGQDAGTVVHSARVANLAVATARQLALPADRIAVLRRAAMLHDIGKIGVPQAILCKPGRLTAEEFRIVQTHPLVGAELLCRAGETEAARIVLQHHENVDGSGYPEGLRGDELDLESRIVRVADSFVAMTLDRPYRAAIAVRDAVDELERCTGSDFDAVVVEALRAVLTPDPDPPDAQPAAVATSV